MAFTTVGATTVTNSVTTVDCQKQVRSWKLLRSLMELLIPTCNCTFIEEDQDIKSEKCHQNYMTGTIFGYRRGKVRFCIQANPESTNPILLLELPVPTSILAKEMRGGTLRIALESASPGSASNLLSTPLWSMHCNGRKVGYATKRRPENSDLEAMRAMRSVVVGAGIIKGKYLNAEDQVMYLRANFRRVRGSSNSESFHLIDPDGTIGQELSIFFFSSK